MAGRRRSVTFADDDGGPPGERQALLHHGEEPDREGSYAPGWRGTETFPLHPHADLPVYNTIHAIRRDIIEAIDDPYSLEQLKDPRMNVSIVRPLVDKWYKTQDCSVGRFEPLLSTPRLDHFIFAALDLIGLFLCSIFCLLVNRAQFLKQHKGAPHYQSVNITRAILCELLANRILRRYSEDNPGPQGLLLLANILAAGFDPFQNAPPNILQENDQIWSIQKSMDGGGRLPALEIAIISESKVFLSSSACQKVVNAIYEGRVVYTPSTFMDIIPDRYKQKPISLYDPRKAHPLNQYRLIVPRTRNWLEIGQFITLLILYVFVMRHRDDGNYVVLEVVFCIYAAGWALDQFASILEHGWHVYTQNLWSFLDVIFIGIYSVYLVLRIHGARTNSSDTVQQAMDVLSIGAPVLIPRLAFNMFSENLLFVSLRSMMADFAGLTALAVWCFGGFLLSMVWLGDGVHGPVTISKWMLWVWFGLDGTGIQRSVDLHWFLGPVVMIAFAFLGNTLFLTILVSMLSNTFAAIASNASAEIQYRRAVLTLEGVKSDAIFAYQPPFNLLAVLVLIPLQFIVSPRWFHKINVAAVRILNAPLLLIIAYMERRTLWSGIRRSPALERTRGLHSWRAFSQGFSVHGAIQEVFDAEPPPPENDDAVDEEEQQDEEEPLIEDPVQGDPQEQVSRPGLGERSVSQKSTGRPRSRRDSMAPFGSNFKDQLREMLNDVGNEEDPSSTGSRLDNLEASLRRIETLLSKIVATEEEEEVVPLEDNDQKLKAEAHE